MNYNSTSTAYPCRRAMIAGIAGDWYFNSDPHAGYLKLMGDIAANNFSEPMEWFTEWNAANSHDPVTEDEIADSAAELRRWYFDNCLDPNSI